jgi:hypothetical protein
MKSLSKLTYLNFCSDIFSIDNSNYLYILISTEGSWRYCVRHLSWHVTEGDREGGELDTLYACSAQYYPSK